MIFRNAVLRVPVSVFEDYSRFHLRLNMRACVRGGCVKFVGITQKFCRKFPRQVFNLEAYVNSKLAYAFVRNTCTYALRHEVKSTVDFNDTGFGIKTLVLGVPAGDNVM